MKPVWPDGDAGGEEADHRADAQPMEQWDDQTGRAEEDESLLVAVWRN